MLRHDSQSTAVDQITCLSSSVFASRSVRSKAVLYRTGQEKYLAATGASMTRPRPGRFESMATEFCPRDVLLQFFSMYPAIGVALYRVWEENGRTRRVLEDRMAREYYCRRGC